MREYRNETLAWNVLSRNIQVRKNNLLFSNLRSEVIIIIIIIIITFIKQVKNCKSYKNGLFKPGKKIYNQIDQSW